VVAVIGAGTLDTLPHNGAVVTLLAVCGATHRQSYFDILLAGVVGPILALVAVIALGSVRSRSNAGHAMLKTNTLIIAR
jgi:H+/gluconate symporter-like permease